MNPSSFKTTDHKYHILLVDDNLAAAGMLMMFLESEGHTAKTAEDVKSALGVAAAERFDLVIGDLMLPDGSGLDLMSELSGRYGMRGIVVSGKGDYEDIEKSKNAGFDVHLTKPIDLNHLLQAIQKVMAPA